MLVTIRTAIDRSVTKPTDHGHRDIDPHGEIGMCLGRNAGTDPRNRKSGANRNR